METRRDILNGVAAGTIAPEDAAVLLTALDDESGDVGETNGRPSAGQRTERGTAGAIRRVRIEAELGKVTVVGDPSVATVSVTGPHELHTAGNTVEVRCEPEASQVGFFMLSRGSRDSRSGGVTIRMNPSLELDLNVAAGKVAVQGVPGPIHAEVEIGSLVIDGFTAPLNLSASAGSVVARGRLDHGASTVRCELGKIRLELAAGSSVDITGRAELGSVSLPGGVRISGLKSLGEEPVATAMLGAGEATLEVATSAGKIEVLGER